MNRMVSSISLGSLAAGPGPRTSGGETGVVVPQVPAECVGLACGMVGDGCGMVGDGRGMVGDGPMVGD